MDSLIDFVRLLSVLSAGATPQKETYSQEIIVQSELDDRFEPLYPLEDTLNISSNERPFKTPSRGTEKLVGLGGTIRDKLGKEVFERVAVLVKRAALPFHGFDLAQPRVFIVRVAHPKLQRAQQTQSICDLLGTIFSFFRGTGDIVDMGQNVCREPRYGNNTSGYAQRIHAKTPEEEEFLAAAGESGRRIVLLTLKRRMRQFACMLRPAR